MSSRARLPASRRFLGRGVAFPPAPRGRLSWVDGEDAVAQALRALLLTEPGERIGRPTWGCGLRRFLFAPNNVATRTLVRRAVEEAIQAFEPRARLLSVVVDTEGDEATRLDVHVRWRGADSPDPRSLVFPFYLDGGGSRP